MIPYMNSLLDAWGRWVVRNQDGGVGWATCSPMFRDGLAGVMPAESRPPIGVGRDADDCEFTDKAVKRLEESDRNLIKAVYVERLRVKDVAARFGWHRQRVSERLNVAGDRLLAHMNDLAADL